MKKPQRVPSASAPLPDGWRESPPAAAEATTPPPAVGTPAAVAGVAEWAAILEGGSADSPAADSPAAAPSSPEIHRAAAELEAAAARGARGLGGRQPVLVRVDVSVGDAARQVSFEVDPVAESAPTLAAEMVAELRLDASMIPEITAQIEEQIERTVALRRDVFSMIAGS